MPALSRSGWLALGLLSVNLTISLVHGAPAHCRACNKNCPGASNSTIVSGDTGDLIAEILGDAASNHTRPKRSLGIEIAPCQAFPYEVFLIPIAISIIPLGLCALLFCTCCCGPKESRAKKPENVIEAVRKYSTSRIKKNNQSEEMELEYRDGYVQRKDSKMTKFSTTVSYIDPPRRMSVWSLGTMSEPPSAPTSPIRKTFSSESFKKTRFSDTVHVCDGDL